MPGPVAFATGGSGSRVVEKSVALSGFWPRRLRGCALPSPRQNFALSKFRFLNRVHRVSVEFDFLLYTWSGHKWRDERGRQLADARAVTTPSACGSSVSWRQAPQSRERLESLRSTITHCTGTGGTTFPPKPAPLMWQAPERPKISSRRSLPTNHWADRPLPDCSRRALPRL